MSGKKSRAVRQQVRRELLPSIVLALDEHTAVIRDLLRRVKDLEAAEQQRAALKATA